jgi:hypothetical protein
MKMLSFILTLGFSPFLWAQNLDDANRERLAERYYKGSVLIYDCRDKHFVCADSESAKDCHELRQQALSRNRFELPCAPLKEFKEHSQCVEEQYRRVHTKAAKNWCYNERKLRF